MPEFAGVGGGVKAYLKNDLLLYYLHHSYLKTLKTEQVFRFAGMRASQGKPHETGGCRQTAPCAAPPAFVLKHGARLWFVFGLEPAWMNLKTCLFHPLASWALPIIPEL